MEDIPTSVVATNEILGNWCNECNASKNSEKHQRHLARRREYNKSERGKKRKRKYEKSSRGKKSARNSKRKRRQKAREAGKCGNHPDRDAVTATLCEECWWKRRAHERLDDWNRGTELQEIIEKQNFKCIYSGIKLIIGINLSIDHFVPQSRGGDNSSLNLGGTLTKLNALKGALTHEEFFQVCKYRWEEHQAGRLKTDEESLLMIHVWNYQLTKPVRPTLFNEISWLP